MKFLIGGLLVLSLSLNLFLWNRLAHQGHQLSLVQVRLNEIEALPPQSPEQNQTSEFDSADPSTRELAKLRNEVGQLRQQIGELTTLRAQAAEAAQLRRQLTAATQNLAHTEKTLSEVLKLSPEELQKMKEEGQSMTCVNNMKQIGLAARLWANDHEGVFPQDFISMKDELGTPKILICPGETTATKVTEWPQLNRASISYRFMNSNGNENEPEKVLVTCPIHLHVGLSDGSVHRGHGR